MAEVRSSMPLLRFDPLLKRIRWGGTLLGERFRKPIGDARDVAESWELCDHPADQTRVQNGPWRGTTLHDLLNLRRAEILGRHAALGRFPLLLKYLDVQDYLSVQVHPNDEQAARIVPGEVGKNEAWIILEAPAHCQVFAGLKQGVVEADLRQALATGQITELLHAEPVRTGDVLLIPAGTVHALSPGLLLAEVQQPSIQTYRLYDWMRLGSDGRPRELHIERALACIDFARGPVHRLPPRLLEETPSRLELLVDSPWFVIRRHTGTVPVRLEQDGRFRALMVLEGRATVHSGTEVERLQCGETLLVGASSPEPALIPQGLAQWLEIYLP